MTIFLYNDALSGSVAPYQLSKFISKLTGLHSIFRKKSIYGANIGFNTLTFARSLGRWRCLKPRTTDLVLKEGHLISPVYMDEELRSVVLLFVRKTVTVPGL